MRKYRYAKRRREAPKWAPNDWIEASMTLLKRDGGRCGWCGKDLNGVGVRHHRMRRRDGGDRLANLVLLHPWCHNVSKGSVHQEPALAVQLGFIVPTWAEPTTLPIRQGGTWFILDDQGGKATCEEPVETP